MKLRKYKALINLYLGLKRQQLNFISLNENGYISKNAMIKGASIYGDVKIENNVKLLNGVSLKTESEIRIGKYTSINGPNTDITAALNRVIIGNYSSIARNVSIQEYNHNYKTISTYSIRHSIFKDPRHTDIYSSNDIFIGHDVWIGTQCVILSGAKIGNGAIIAANSVVTGEIPPYSIAGGTPAKVIKYRFEKNIIDALINLEWWNWSEEKMKKNKSLFVGNISLEKIENIK